MIEGFDDDTCELSSYEKTLVPIIVSKIKGNIGEEMAVKNKDIIRRLNSMGYEKITAARIRKIIHYIRVSKKVTNLIATSKGYYRAKSKSEIEKFVLSLQQRINSIQSVRDSFL